MGVANFLGYSPPEANFLGISPPPPPFERGANLLGRNSCDTGNIATLRCNPVWRNLYPYFNYCNNEILYTKIKTV
jgi:hypothetical protein